MTQEQVEQFEKLDTQLKGLYEEVSNLSKKSQNDLLNKFKLKFINQAIRDANTLLGEKYKPYSEFDAFDEVDMPSNSDGAVMLGQYINCMEVLRADNIEWESNGWYWIINGEISEIQTKVPKKIIK